MGKSPISCFEDFQQENISDLDDAFLGFGFEWGWVAVLFIL